MQYQSTEHIIMLIVLQLATVKELPLESLSPPYAEILDKTLIRKQCAWALHNQKFGKCSDVYI